MFASLLAWQADNQSFMQPSSLQQICQLVKCISNKNFTHTIYSCEHVCIYIAPTFSFFLRVGPISQFCFCLIISILNTFFVQRLFLAKSFLKKKKYSQEHCSSTLEAPTQVHANPHPHSQLSTIHLVRESHHTIYVNSIQYLIDMGVYLSVHGQLLLLFPSQVHFHTLHSSQPHPVCPMFSLYLQLPGKLTANHHLKLSIYLSV